MRKRTRYISESEEEKRKRSQKGVPEEVEYQSGTPE
jgi:hypothetical protein